MRAGKLRVGGAPHPLDPRSARGHRSADAHPARHDLAPWDPRAGGGQRVQHELAVHAVGAGHDVRVLYVGRPGARPNTPYEIVWVRERRAPRLQLAGNAVAVARAVRALAGAGAPT
jgi:hypothetical protein